MVKNRASSSRFSWSSLSLWVGMTVVGYLLNSINHFPASFAVAPFNAQAITLDGAPLGFVIGAISGLILATLQAIVLQSYLPSVRRWILGNTIGFSLIHALGDTVAFPLFLLVGGIIIGLVQYFSLRPYLRNALLWLPITAFAWFSGLQLGVMISPENNYNLLFGALSYSLITGIAFRFLLAENLEGAANPFHHRLKERWSQLNRSTRILLITFFCNRQHHLHHSYERHTYFLRLE